MEAGACPQLARLEFRWSKAPRKGARAQVAALRREPCRRTLVALGFDAGGGACRRSMEVLGDLLLKGRFPRLEELYVDGDGYAWADVRPLLEGIVGTAGSGRPCGLTLLHLDASAALESDVLPHLYEFSYDGPVTRGGPSRWPRRCGPWPRATTCRTSTCTRRPGWAARRRRRCWWRPGTRACAPSFPR